MSSWQTIAKTFDVPVGEGRTYSVDGKLIALFNVEGQFLAVNDLCPHMGASLSEGWVENGAVTCPWHAWRFCLKDGSWLDAPKSKVRTETFDVRVEGDEVQIDIESGDSAAGPEQSHAESS